MRQGNSTPMIDQQYGNRPASINTSPAGSTFSLASMVNQCQAAPALSTITTPGNAHPPSPLYYDYTEEFDIDDYDRPGGSDPPPQFLIEKTIPEDRPLSSGWPSKQFRDISNPGTFYVGEYSSSSPSKRLDLPGGCTDHRLASVSIDNAIDSTRSGGSSSLAHNADTLKHKPANNSRDTTVLRLPRVGYGAQELNNHVDEVFGLVPSPSINLSDTSETKYTDSRDAKTLPISDNRASDGADIELQSTRTSSYSFNTHLQQFPPPPVAINPAQIHILEVIGTRNPKIALGHDEDSSLSPITSSIPSQCEKLARLDLNGGVKRSSPPQRSASTRATPEISNIGIQIKKSVADMQNLSPTLRHSVLSQRMHTNETKCDNMEKASRLPLTPPNELLLEDASSAHRTEFTISSSDQPGNGKRQNAIYKKAVIWGDHRTRGRRMETATVPSSRENDSLVFDHPISGRLMSRSESPLLAPKPISPARQLKLKNSIPQLMKALPPLPPEQSAQSVSPNFQRYSCEAELPGRLSLVKPEGISAMAEDTPEVFIRPTNPVPIYAKQAPIAVELNSQPEGTTPQDSEECSPSTSAQPLPKLKLKPRNSAMLRPSSPPHSRPWNLEESYPWSSQYVNVSLPSMAQADKPNTSKPPRFKLRITRASNSTLGTIRVNRDSSIDSKTSGGLYLRNPVDLFTPNSGLDGIFRQVSRHLHSRRESVNDNNIISPDYNVERPISDQNGGNLPSILSLNDVQDSSTSSTTPLNPPDARSCFSDDSSKPNGRHDLRRRLSNFRARITVPYSNRLGSQSYDDITWRDRNGSGPSVPSPTRSQTDLSSSRMIAEVRRSRRLTHRMRTLRFRAKVSEWFRGARTVIAARVKSRNTTGKAVDEGVSVGCNT